MLDLTTIPIWQKITLSAFVLIALLIYIKLSQFKIRKIHLVPLKYRIALALFFPLVFVILFLFSSIILAIALIILFILFLFSLFKIKRIRI